MTKLLSDPDLILGSNSPRRRELLESVGLRLAICPPEINETPLPGEHPRALLHRLVERKVAATRKLAPVGPLLCADTSVILNPESATPEILGKPSSPEQAKAMLERLSGRTHQVWTAYCLDRSGVSTVRIVTTEVEFRRLRRSEIDGYIASNEWRDKAGGYAIQGGAAAFVRRISGSYTNVVGLPLAEVVEELMAAQILPLAGKRK